MIAEYPSKTTRLLRIDHFINNLVWCGWFGCLSFMAYQPL